MKKLLILISLFVCAFSKDKLYIGKDLGFVSSYFFVILSSDSIGIIKFDINKIGYYKNFEKKEEYSDLKDSFALRFNDSVKVQRKENRLLVLFNEKKIKLKSCTIEELHKYENLSTVSKVTDGYFKSIIDYCNLCDENKNKLWLQTSNYYLENDNLILEPEVFENGFIRYFEQQLSRIDSTCNFRNIKY